VQNQTEKKASLVCLKYTSCPAVPLMFPFMIRISEGQVEGFSSPSYMYQCITKAY